MLNNTLQLPGWIEQHELFILVTDAAGRTVYVNLAFLRNCGHEREKFLGRAPGEILQGPATDPALRAQFRDAIQSGAALTVRGLVNYRHNGAAYKVNIHLEPVRGGGGAVIFFVAAARETAQDASHAVDELLAVTARLVENLRRQGNLKK